MAKFLDTQGVSYYLGKLIDNAEQRLYLISPYLQLNNQLKIALEDRAKFRIDIIMIYGKVADLNPKDSEWLENIDDIKLLFHQDLHTKCYINEKEAIVTSMNLYMYSQQNNVEMGIYVSKADDQELYKQILNEADKIKRGSEHRTISVQKVSDKESQKRKKEKPLKESNTNSKLVTTKELSQLTGLSSRKVNSWLIDEKLMYKKDDDWVTTKRGKEIGGIEKSGQYGQFIIWPEEIGKQMAE